MNVDEAPRRTIDYYAAILDNFVLVDGPSGKVLIPPAMRTAGWEFKEGVSLMSFVPHFTRDWETGGGLLRRGNPDLLERLIRDLVRRHFGDEIPELPT